MANPGSVPETVLLDVPDVTFVEEHGDISGGDESSFASRQSGEKKTSTGRLLSKVRALFSSLPILLSSSLTPPFFSVLMSSNALSCEGPVAHLHEGRSSSLSLSLPLSPLVSLSCALLFSITFVHHTTIGEKDV